MKKHSNELEAWEGKKVTVTMTNDQWSKLTTYLHMSSNHRNEEAKTWEKLAKEVDQEGQPVYKNAASNAEFWRELIEGVENALKIIEKRRIS